MAGQIDRHGVQRLLQENAQLVDVLSAKDYEAEHIPRAINIPLKTLGQDVARRLDGERQVIVYCHDYQ